MRIMMFGMDITAVQFIIRNDSNRLWHCMVIWSKPINHCLEPGTIETSEKLLI